MGSDAILPQLEHHLRHLAACGGRARPVHPDPARCFRSEQRLLAGWAELLHQHGDRGYVERGGTCDRRRGVQRGHSGHLSGHVHRGAGCLHLLPYAQRGGVHTGGGWHHQRWRHVLSGRVWHAYAQRSHGGRAALGAEHRRRCELDNHREYHHQPGLGGVHRQPAIPRRGGCRPLRNLHKFNGHGERDRYHATHACMPALCREPERIRDCDSERIGGRWGQYGQLHPGLIARTQHQPGDGLLRRPHPLGALQEQLRPEHRWLQPDR